MTRNLTVDGVSLEMTETTAQVVQRALDSGAKAVADGKTALDAANASLADVNKKLNDSVAIIATKDAEIVKLQTQLKDAELSPAKIDAAMMDRVAVVEKGKAILGDKLVLKDQTTNQIRKQVVSAHVGDMAKDWNDDMIKVSFDTISVKTHDAGQGVSNIVNAFSRPTLVTDESGKAYDEYNTWLTNAYKKPAVAS